MEDELTELIYHDKPSNNFSAIEILTEELLEIVLNNRTDEIDNIIAHSTKEVISHKYSTHGNKNILIIACINGRVTTETLASLCVAVKCYHPYVNCHDENWYMWEAVHYIARNADPIKLQVLVRELDELDVNSLTTFSENALHVLLEYEESVKPFGTYLYNGNASRQCTIISTEKENTIQCAKILIDAGIDVNHSNFWNETPICIAVRYRYIRIIELLLKKPYIDIDNYKEGSKTVREYLKKHNIFQERLPQSNFLHEDPIKILFNYLKSGNERRFLQFNNENIKDYANLLDGENAHNSCGNMLQYCFKKGFIEYLQHDMYNEELSECDIIDSPMLKIFCDKGLPRCIEHLLNNGADPKLTNRKFPKPLLEASATLGFYPLVAILLQHKTSKITALDIYDVLPKLFQVQPNLKNHEYYRKHVLGLLVNKLLNMKGSPALTNWQLTTLNKILGNLNLEKDEGDDDTENICQILRLGASLTSKRDEKAMIIECIHPDTLRTHFDDCIDNNMFCYNSIIRDEYDKYSETKALYFLANNKKKKALLQHPLLIHFIHNKWVRIFYFFYIDIFVYSMFLLSIYAYMITSQMHCYPYFITVPFYCCLAFHTAKETTQLLIYHLQYFLDTSNYLELTAIASCIVTIFYPNEYSRVLAILSSTLIYFMLLGQLPICAKYTIIFGSTKYFVQYAGFYFFQFVSFALVFFIIFPFKAGSADNLKRDSTNVDDSSSTDLEKFGNIIGGLFKSLFYTLIFFTGEFNERVLEPENFPIFGRVIMTIFIFCMTIILNNLLVGLIVADMNEMKTAGKLYKQINTVNFIVRMNAIIKRLKEFQSLKCIEDVINYLQVFKKGTNKILDLSHCKHTGVFSEEDWKYLKDIRNRKTTPAYNKDLLKNVYSLIQKRVNEYSKIKEST